MLKNKLGFALTEGIMYQSADNTLDLRILNPAAIYHDYYIRGNSNSILSGELNYSPISYVNLYGQMVVDEFVLPGEPLLGEPRLNHIIAIPMFSNAFEISYTEDFMGYQYGCDAIVYNGNIGYKQFGKWYVSMNLFYIVHGTHDKWTLWADVSSASLYVSTPSTQHNIGNNGE
ncbi:MAG TPA: hypothetical protein PK105_09560 [Rectinema sp.]|jgi:hypothetical protein|nr:hypothetical protein [Rectinema sp.]